MKTNNEIIEPLIDLRSQNRYIHALSVDRCSQAMKEARIDTLEHLKKQFEVNFKKLNRNTALLLVNQLIQEIQKP